MGCTGCQKLAKKKAQARLAAARSGPTIQGSETDMEDKNYLLCRYEHPNRGQHRVYGVATDEFYGYHGAGAEFYVHKQDIARQPNVYKPITKANPTPKKKVKETSPPAPMRDNQEETLPASKEPLQEDALTAIPGVSDSIASDMNAMGIHAYKDILEVDIVDLMTIKGVGEATAAKILEYVSMHV